MKEIMRPITTVDEVEVLISHGYAALRCNMIAEEVQIMYEEVQGLPETAGATLRTVATLLRQAHDEIVSANRERLEVREEIVS